MPIAEQVATNARTLEGFLKSTDDGPLSQLFARTLASGGESARTEYGDFLRQLEAKAPERRNRFEQTEMSAVPSEARAKLAQGNSAGNTPSLRHNIDTRTTDDNNPQKTEVPIINEEKARIQNIIEDNPARFQIRHNPEADGSERIHEFDILGIASMNEHDHLIQKNGEKALGRS